MRHVAALLFAVTAATLALPADAADKAWEACRNGAPEASIKGCTTVIDRGAKEGRERRAFAHFNRGNAYFNLGDVKAAIADYGEAVALKPRFPDAFFNRGNGYFNLGDLDQAIADYDAVLRLDRGYLNAYINRGNAFREKGDFDQALGDYAAALKRDPKNELAKANRDQALAEQAAAPAVKPAETTVAAAPTSDDAKAPAIAVDESRIALVIGNSAYTAVGKLPNPERDAAAMAEALKGAGFKDVTVLLDADRPDLVGALNAFADKAAAADWAVVYFAGHGIEIDGVNYLIPTDAKLAADRDVQDEAVALDRVIAAVDGAKKIRLVILDACRNNPFVPEMKMTVPTRAIHRGLARIEPAGGTLVAFAAEGGEVAIDGEGVENSPFAAALVNRLNMPGLEIGKLFRLVRDDVVKATGARQKPFVYGSLSGEDFYFRPPQ